MNYEQASSVKELAAPVNKVLEGLKVECPECKGRSIITSKLNPLPVPFPQDFDGDCDKCGNTGKVKWKWQPKMGEYIHIRFPSGIESVQRIASLYDESIWVVAPCEYPPPSLVIIERNHIIPILEWQVIEGILEKAGYYFDMKKDFTGGTVIHVCTISKDVIVTTESKSRTRTVYEVVLALGKEMEE